MTYTSDWHSRHAAVWQKLVLPRLACKRVRWLEIGSHEGRSAVWTLENAIKPGDELVCVDYWPHAAAEAKFDENVGSRVTKVKQDATRYLIEAAGRGERYQCIYVDSDHDGRAIVEQAAIAWLMLAVGGVMIFDDYRWKHPASQVGNIDPCVGIDAFLASYALELTLLHKGDQVIVEKRAHVY